MEDKALEDGREISQDGLEAPQTPSEGMGEIIRQELERRVAELEASLSQVQEESDSFKDRWMRAQADLENYKKRMVKERQEDRLLALQESILAFMPVADNLERAALAAQAHLAEAPSPVLDQLLQGVLLTLKQHGVALERLKTTEISAEKGQVFDPTMHQALLQETHEALEDGSILEVLQKGYMLENRVIRPALVKVSRKP
jgi:molecular chaperone GrpE